MRQLFILLLVAIWAPGILCFGLRGAAERAVYYAIYMAEEALDEGQMKFASGCSGHRTGARKQKERCYLSEFLIWIDRKDLNIDYKQVMIGDSTTELGELEERWGKQAGLDDLSPRERVQWITNAIDTAEMRIPFVVNPPSDDSIKLRGQGVNPTPFEGNVDYTHIDGIQRDDSVAKYQEFVRTIAAHQERLNAAIKDAPDGELKTLVQSWLKTLTLATENVAELRMADHFNVAINGNNGQNMKTLSSTFKDSLVTETIYGEWATWEVPDRQKTIDKSLAKGIFDSAEKAGEEFDKIANTEKAQEHINVFTDWKDQRGVSRHRKTFHQYCLHLNSRLE
ncbi:hypothetical protein MGU_08729 [Metarhizium guizhouense ARSEF 977]|uniref:Uncharacterized protein n=1 Tax=Metarhizium guizhouense (strain ARSEF 977) TaxID=1276136 RepID=A0A0B4H2W3_METGA|nr:hypothetical protein MGU_08729 [Metarhizium guizhouense ARSEF 977]